MSHSPNFPGRGTPRSSSRSKSLRRPVPPQPGRMTCRRIQAARDLHHLGVNKFVTFLRSFWVGQLKEKQKHCQRFNRLPPNRDSLDFRNAHFNSLQLAPKTNSLKQSKSSSKVQKQYSICLRTLEKTKNIPQKVP